MDKAIGYSILEKILSGVSTRDAVFEALSQFRNNGDYESISNERELMGFNGTIAAFAPDIKMTSSTPEYNAYSFKVYCPDLISSVYDADDPHPLQLTVYLPPTVDPKQTGFTKSLRDSFETGLEIRDALKFLYAPGETVFKSMRVEPLWRK